MDEAQLLAEYLPYIRKAARWFNYPSAQSRIDYEDLFQEGVLALTVLLHRGKNQTAPAIKKAIRLSMLNLALKSCSPLHVTSHALYAAKCEETKEKRLASVSCCIPLQKLVEEGREIQSPSLYAEIDDSDIFVSSFLDGLTPRERIVCLALMDDMSEREISRVTGIPHITVRRTHTALREKLKRAMEDPV